MKSNNIISEVSRIRELMSINEISLIEQSLTNESILNEQAWGKFLRQVFSNGSRVAAKVTPRLMQVAEKELDDLIRINSSLPARVAGESGPAYMRRIADSGVSDDLLKKAYNIYLKHNANLADDVLDAVKTQINGDSELLTKLAKANSSDEDLIKYLESFGFKRGSTEMSELVTSVSNVRKSLPVDLKIKIPKKWYDLKRLEISAENVSQQTARAMENAFSDGLKTMIYKQIDAKQGIQKFANNLILDLETKGFKSVAEAEEFIANEMENILTNQTNLINKVPETFWQKVGKKAFPDITKGTNFQKYIAMSYYYNIVATLYELATYKSQVENCAREKSQKENIDFNSLAPLAKQNLRQNCFNEWMATTAGQTLGTKFLGIGFDLTWELFDYVGDADLGINTSTEDIKGIYNDNLDDFKKFLNSGSVYKGTLTEFDLAVANIEEINGIKYYTYVPVEIDSKGKVIRDLPKRKWKYVTGEDFVEEK